MAKKYSITNIASLNSDITIQPKKKSMLCFTNLTCDNFLHQINSTSFSGNDLIITLNNNTKITLSNYIYQIKINSSRYFQFADGTTYDFLLSGKIDNPVNYTNPTKKTTLNAGIFNDDIDVSTYRFTKKVKISKKEYEYQEILDPNKSGLKINADYGDDKIKGSIYSDRIYGGYGDDIIDGGAGNDIIYGNQGKNTINYTKGDGNDIIYLTKGENLTLNLNGLSLSDIKSAIVGKDLILSYKINDTTFTINLKNFGKYDVTNNAVNTKKVKTDDTSSVLLTFNGITENAIDLRKDLIVPVNITKNYTGTYHNEYIDASNYEIKKKVKISKKKYEWITLEDASLKGLTIKTNVGENKVVGSQYSDKIYCGSGNNTIIGYYGNDTIYGGIGSNTFIFEDNYNNDILYSYSTTDTIKFSDITEKEQFTLTQNKNDLIISTKNSDNKTGNVTIKNYFATNYQGVQNVNYNFALNSAVFESTTITDLMKEVGINLSGSNVINGYYYYKNIITGSDNQDIIYGGQEDDVIISNNAYYRTKIKKKWVTQVGGDKIIGGKGNDTITTGNGNNLLYFDIGDGSDIINKSEGNDTLIFNQNVNLTFSRKENSNDLIIKYGENDSITLVDYFDSESSHNVKQYIINGSEAISLADSYELYTNTQQQTNRMRSGILTNSNPDLTDISEKTFNLDGTIETVKNGTFNTFNIKENSNFVELNLINSETTKLLGNTELYNSLVFEVDFEKLNFDFKNNNLSISGYGSENDTLKLNSYNLSNIDSYTQYFDTKLTYIPEYVSISSDTSGGNILKNYSYTYNSKIFTGLYLLKTNDYIINRIIYTNDINTNLYGTDENDLIYKGNNSDCSNTLEGSVISSGKGNDIIMVDNFNNKDYIAFNKDDGKDIIYLNDNLCNLKFDNSINLNDIQVNKNESDIVIRYTDNDDISIKLNNQINEAKLYLTNSDLQVIREYDIKLENNDIILNLISNGDS